MGNFVPELREKGDLFGWARRLTGYLRSTVLRGGRGIQVNQTDSGTTVTLANHGADHAPGGKDETKFQTLEIVWTDPNNPENQKRIIFNPNWEDFQADRIFAVNDAGTFTGWRTLLDLLDGLTGFAADKALVVNATGDGLEWGDAGSAPANTALENQTYPFEAGKLVVGVGNPHELQSSGKSIVGGGDYGAYSNSLIPTESHAAWISDVRFNQRFTEVSGIMGLGGIGQVAVFYDDRLIEGQHFGTLFNSTFPTGALGSGSWIFTFSKPSGVYGYSSLSWLLQTSISGHGNSKKLTTDASGNIAWTDESGSIPAGTGQYKVLQLNASNQPVWDYVRAH